MDRIRQLFVNIKICSAYSPIGRVLFLLVSVLMFQQNADALQTRIVPGSVVTITVLGYPELSQTVEVSPDGTTAYPLLLNVPIDGMTTADLREVLSPILTRYVERPRLFISISDYIVKRVQILGEVNIPGQQKIEGSADLQGALAMAGGATETADLRRINIFRKIEGNRDTTLTINLIDRQRMASGGYKLITLEDEDIIVIPTLREDSFVRVIGSVRLPGKYVPGPNETVIDLINRAGGATDYNFLKYVIHNKRDNNRFTSVDLDLKQILREGSREDLPYVSPGDIIIVNQPSEYKQLKFWAELIRNVAMLASAYIIFSRL